MVTFLLTTLSHIYVIHDSPNWLNPFILIGGYDDTFVIVVLLEGERVNFRLPCIQRTLACSWTGKVQLVSNRGVNHDSKKGATMDGEERNNET